jgi:hypothetical protein
MIFRRYIIAMYSTELFYILGNKSNWSLGKDCLKACDKQFIHYTIIM